MVVSLNDFNVEIEDLRSGRLIVDFMYNFFLGHSLRSPNLHIPRLATSSPTVSSKTTTPRTNVLPGSRSSTPQSVPASKLANPNVPLLPVVSPAGGIAGSPGLPPYPMDGMYNPPNQPNSSRGTQLGGPAPFYSQSSTNFDGSNAYGSPYNTSGFSMVGNQGVPHGSSQYPSYEGFPYQGPASGRSGTGSKGDSPISYQSGYTTTSVHTNSRPGSKNESPTTHPINPNPPHLPPYY
jgi:hypothetical protein